MEYHHLGMPTREKLKDERIVQLIAWASNPPVPRMQIRTGHFHRNDKYHQAQKGQSLNVNRPIYSSRKNQAARDFIASAKQSSRHRQSC